MKPEKYLPLTLAVTLACATAPQTREITTTREDTMKQACLALGIGEHDFNGDELLCFSPHGVYFQRRNYDMPPEARSLNIDEFSKIISGKQIVLVGEDHGDLDIPVEKLIAIFAHEKFDYIALELDEKIFQGMIDQFYLDGDEESIKKFFKSRSLFTDEVIDVIIIAKQYGIKIKCIDNRQKESYPNGEFSWDFRESLLEGNLRKILDGGKRVAVIIGEGHINHNFVSYFINGSDDEGFPNSVKLHHPLGYRMAQRYGKQNTFSISVDSPCGERFIDGYLESK